MGDTQEPGGSCLQSTSNQRQVSPVLYLFIHLLVLSTGRSHYFLRYKVFGFVKGMDNTPRRWIPGWLTCLMRSHFPWSLLIPLLLIMIWAFRFGNNKITPLKLFSHTLLMMILNTDPLAATKSWINQVSAHFESFTILLSSSAHK